MCILKQLFFSILVNSGRIFTLPPVNILPLFTSTSKKKEKKKGSLGAKAGS